LPPALPAPAYLGIPAGAELIKALMRSILAAISAEAAEPFGSVAGNCCGAPTEVRPRRPISVRREQTLQAVYPRGGWANPADGTALRHQGKTNSIEYITKGKRQGGPSDHRVLQRGTDIAASTMPVETIAPSNAFRCSTRNSFIGTGSGNCIGLRHEPGDVNIHGYHR
jgi:hypothetical protein